MGFQTVSEKLLESLGREGSKSIYEKAVENIRAVGFDRLNIDLMYGFLNQSDEDFANTIKYTIALNPEFITLYRNRYKGTKLESESQGVTLYKVNRQYDIAYNLLRKPDISLIMAKIHSVRYQRIWELHHILQNV